MKEHDARLGGAQHHDPIDRGHVDTLVEHIHRADRLEFAALQIRQRPFAVIRALTCVDRGDLDSFRPQPSAHEIGMGNAATEHERATTAVGPPRAPQRRHAGLGLRRLRERVGIEPAVTPRNVLVVDVVLDADVMEWRQATEVDTARDVGSIGNEVIEQTEDVRRVSTIRRRRQAEKERRIDAIEDPPI